MDSNITLDESFEERVLEKVSKIANDPEIEVEYKFKISGEHILNILQEKQEEWSDKCELEQTVNLIYDRVIKRMTFHNRSKPVSDSYKKTRIMDIKFPYSELVKLSVSKESKQSDPRGNITSVRIKNRISIPYDKYRIDITQVISMNPSEFNNDPSKIRVNRTMLFDKMLGAKDGKEIYKKFISNYRPSVKMEMEVEYTSHDLTIEDLKINSIVEPIPKLVSLITSNILLREIVKLNGDKINKSISVKNVLSSAETITQSLYNKIYPPINYYITHKADGDRCCLYISNKSYYITSQEIKKVPISTPKRSIFDCELVKGDFLIFDCIEYEDINMIDKTLPQRIEAVNKFIKSRDEKIYVPKKYFLITSELEKSFRLATDYKFNYPEDGFILSSSKESYYRTKNYKIKQSNTIDFLAIHVDHTFTFPIKQGKELFILFNGINEYQLKQLQLHRIKGYGKIFGIHEFSGYVPIQFSPADMSNAYLWYTDKKTYDDLSKHFGMYTSPSKKEWLIVELEPKFKDGKFKEWIYHKVRDDRAVEEGYFGNDFIKTAEVNWFASQNPLQLKEMHKPVDTYFSTEKSPIYKAQTSSMSYAKSYIIKKASREIPNLFALDLAAGKGQDLGRYMDIGFERGVFIDIDRVAIASLLSKRYDMIKNTKGYYSTKKFNVKVGVLDLNEPATDNYEKLKMLFGDDSIKPAFINCNLAIHYMVYDIKKLANLVKLITMCIAKGGYFAYTTFNGKKVFELLKENNGDWVFHKDEVVKFRLTANYKTDTFTGFNQQIKVKLPFSGNEMYEESLVNIEVVNDVFKKSGFTIVETGSILDIAKDHMKIQDKNSANLYNSLDEGDKKYLDLYQYVVLKYT